MTDQPALNFALVNEEGEEYVSFGSFESALAMLLQFPNDTIVVKVVSL